MIKKYIDFIKESNGYRIPDHFVELNSIGHYLDTLSGEMYPMYADGSFDEDEAFGVYDDLDDHDGLSEDDKRLIDSFRISIEELIGDKINLDLMEDIIDKCISEGLVDEGVEIVVRAIVLPQDIPTVINLYRIDNQNNNINYTWYRVFKDEANTIASLKKDYIVYKCKFTYVRRYEEELKPKMDSVERFVKDAYPDVKCDFLQLMDNYRTI
jgi:hypothetical protein